MILFKKKASVINLGFNSDFDAYFFNSSILILSQLFNKFK